MTIKAYLAAINTINAFTDSELRNVALILATSDPEVFNKAATDFNNAVNNIHTLRYQNDGEQYDFSLTPEFLETLESHTNKIYAIKWLRQTRTPLVRLLAAKHAVEFLAHHGLLRYEMLGNVVSLPPEALKTCQFLD
ncbi:MAG: hypothetical protein JWP44_5113 [Mucilaginibacter sp.]|nr:hypothetical protein [Mucilaginibacter sp.]